jgi:hypothetical protein
MRVASIARLPALCAGRARHDCLFLRFLQKEKPDVRSANFIRVPWTFSPNAYVTERMNHSKYIQEPEHNNDDHDGVQDGLDASCHGNEAIHQPQEDAYYDQDDYKVD